METNASNVPSDIAHAWSVGNIPSDITLATLLDSRDGPSKTGIYIVFALAFVFLLFRCYSRLFIVRKFGLDDWLACLTFVSRFFSCFESGALSMFGELTISPWMIDSLYTPRADMCFVNKQRKRSTQRVCCLCHVPRRRSNEPWRIARYSHAFPIHHRALYLSPFRSRILQSTIRRSRKALHIHPHLHNLLRPLLPCAILSSPISLPSSYRQMAVFMAG